MYVSTVEKKCLIVKLTEKVEDLSFINTLFSENCHHLILNLQEIELTNATLLSKFATFGKKLVGTNSFVMVSTQFLNSEWNIVPTLKEAFDIIELEDIERQLNF